MLFKNINIIDENFKIKKEQNVLVEKDRITYVGNDIPKYYKGDEYNGSGKLLMSGFFNIHAHSPMTLMRGYGENMNLQDWLEKKIFPFEACLDSEAVYWGTMLAAAESLKNGIVSTSDMYYFCEDMINAFSDAKVKVNIGRAVTCFGSESINELESFHEAEDVYKKYNGAENGRIKVDMSLHAEYTSTEKIVRELAEKTCEMGTRMHVHVSETKFECEKCKERHQGRTPIKYFYDCGLFNARTTAAHCVWIEDEDIEILKYNNVTVASCPVSNLKLASGVCRASDLIERGVNVGIGTDSVASNNSLDYFEEMKFFALLGKGFMYDPTLLTPKQVLYAGTRAGALSQDRNDSGMILAGNKADLIVLDIDSLNMQPEISLTNNLVYSGSAGQVELTMVDGNILYRKGQFTTIDIEKVKYNVNRITDKILEKL